MAPPSDPPSISWTTTARQDYEFTVHHLNREVAMESSPVLLHHALTAVFVAVETNIREKELFCDKFCEQGPLLNSKLKVFERFSIKFKSRIILYYTRVVSGRIPLCDLAPGQHSFEQTSQRWPAVGYTDFALTGNQTFDLLHR